MTVKIKSKIHLPTTMIPKTVVTLGAAYILKTGITYYDQTTGNKSDILSPGRIIKIISIDGVKTNIKIFNSKKTWSGKTYYTQDKLSLTKCQEPTGKEVVTHDQYYLKTAISACAYSQGKMINESIPNENIIQILSKKDSKKVSFVKYNVIIRTWDENVYFMDIDNLEFIKTFTKELRPPQNLIPQFHSKLPKTELARTESEKITTGEYYEITTALASRSFGQPFHFAVGTIIKITNAKKELVCFESISHNDSKIWEIKAKDLKGNIKKYNPVLIHQPYVVTQHINIQTICVNKPCPNPQHLKYAPAAFTVGSKVIFIQKLPEGYQLQSDNKSDNKCLFCIKNEDIPDIMSKIKAESNTIKTNIKIGAIYSTIESLNYYDNTSNCKILPKTTFIKIHSIEYFTSENKGEFAAFKYYFNFLSENIQTNEKHILYGDNKILTKLHCVNDIINNEKEPTHYEEYYKVTNAFTNNCHLNDMPFNDLKKEQLLQILWTDNECVYFEPLTESTDSDIKYATIDIFLKNTKPIYNYIPVNQGIKVSQVETIKHESDLADSCAIKNVKKLKYNEIYNEKIKTAKLKKDLLCHEINYFGHLYKETNYWNEKFTLKAKSEVAFSYIHDDWVIMFCGKCYGTSKASFEDAI